MSEKISIVLADDHPLTKEGMKAFLLNVPEFNIVGAYEDGESALKGIQEQKPDIALLDIRMPKIDGVTLARKIKEAALPTKILMLTSYDAQQYVMASLKAGARGYILKTTSADILANAIKTVARGGFYLDSEVSTVNEDSNAIPDNISVREREVLVLAAKGYSGKEIAAKLYISERTVQTHLASIYDKIGAKNKTEAMLLAIKYGIVTLEELLN